MKSFIVAVAVLACFLPGTVKAGLIGDSVDITVFNAVTQQPGVVVGPGIEGTFFWNIGNDERIEVDVSNTSISIKAFDSTGVWAWFGNSQPVVVTVGDLDFGAPFTATHTVNSSLIGPVVFDSGADFVSLTFDDHYTYFTSGTVLDVTIDLVGTVSEPPVVALFGLGMIGLAVAARRRVHG